MVKYHGGDPPEWDTRLYTTKRYNIVGFAGFDMHIVAHHMSKFGVRIVAPAQYRTKFAWAQGGAVTVQINAPSIRVEIVRSKFQKTFIPNLKITFTHQVHRYYPLPGTGSVRKASDFQVFNPATMN